MATAPGLTQDLTCQGDALSILAAQYVNRPLMTAVQVGVGTRAQTIETVLWQIYTQMGISPNAAGMTIATGYQLDVLGKIVGLPRQGNADAQYTLLLQARIRTLTACGTTPQLQTLLKIITTGNNVPNIQDVYPAAILVQEFTVPETNPAIVYSVLNAARPAGVRAILEYLGATLPNTFRYDVGPGYDVGAYAGAIG